MALSDFETPELWRQDLDARWPERIAIKRVLKNTLVAHLADSPNPKVLELGIGDGELLTDLADIFRQSDFVAMDINQLLLTHCQSRLRDNRMTFVNKDLSKSWSAGFENTFDAVFSLQSVHDFGGRDALTLTYAEIARVLKPGGILLNADFIVPMSHDDPAAQRRFPADVHGETLSACGFESIVVLHQEGTLGCMSGVMPGHS